MCQRILSLWFVCKLCRGSFGQVDAFIEHKKQKHFNEFQNTTSIVFEEREQCELCPTIVKVENQLVDESNELPIKTEVNNKDPIDPVSSEIFDEPNLALVEPKSELVTYESEINPDNQNNFFSLEQPEQNPYVLLKRLTPEEIKKSARVPQHYSRRSEHEKKSVANNFDSPYSFNVDKTVFDYNEVEKSTENQPSPIIRDMFTKVDLQFECKLCSKQLESDAQLKIHVGICALYHKHRNRFCVSCNRKFSGTDKLKDHRLRFHGTEEEKLSLFKFKCHVCPKQYREARDLRFHLESHGKKTQHVRTSNAKSFKCSQPNCGKEFQGHSALQNHISGVHLGVRPFSCHFPNCNKNFSCRGNLSVHLRIHTGERPYKCTVDNCNKAFITSQKRYFHYRNLHCM